MLDFSNTEIAFSAKSNNDLRLAQMLFAAIGSNSLVKFMKGATELALSIKFPVGWAVKPTLYRHFVGGERLEDCTKTTDILAKSKVMSILDYSAEAGEAESDIEHAYNEIMHSIEYTATNPYVEFAVFKPTAMTTEHILGKANAKGDFTREEQVKYDEYRKRIYNLCKRAYELNVKILIDAEDFCFQDDIDLVCEEMMREFNKERAIVFNTLQMYRHDRLEYLKRVFDDAVEGDYYLGIKFVRGAYMEKERERAIEGGYPSPICDTKELTDINYNDGLRFTIENIDRIDTFCGTHNEESNKLLASMMAEKGIAKDDKRIWFAQLYGMSDNISYNLAHDGYNITKYIPYAPVDRVLPYLIRRAEENTSMAGQTSRELGYINTEIKRRENIKGTSKI
ncbi:MAG: proline dehydrogenase family protein [Rikenellaceae bacterium]